MWICATNRKQIVISAVLNWIDNRIASRINGCIKLCYCRNVTLHLPSTMLPEILLFSLIFLYVCERNNSFGLGTFEDCDKCIVSMARITLAKTVEWNWIEKNGPKTEYSEVIVLCAIWHTEPNWMCASEFLYTVAFMRVSIMYVNFNLIDENSDCCERRGSTRRLWEVSGCAIVRYPIPSMWYGTSCQCTQMCSFEKNENVADTLSWGATTFQRCHLLLFLWCTENYNTYILHSFPRSAGHIYSLTRMNFGESIQ